MDPQNNQLPQQPTDNISGGVPPTPPQPGQQFAPQQPGTVTPGAQPSAHSLTLATPPAHLRAAATRPSFA
jgi:hypothetical protein